MPEGVYTRRIIVAADDLDQNHHVNNIVYVRWMNDVAIEHSAAGGWPMSRYLDERVAWVVRSHAIEYLRPAGEGDDITLMTWVNAMKGSNCTRRYVFVRARERKQIVSASTVWVYVGLDSGRIQRIPEALRAAFPVTDDAAALAGVT